MKRLGTHQRPDPRRRAAVVATLGLPALVGTSLSGCMAGPSADRQLSFLTLDAAEKELGFLAQSGALRSDAVWSWAQTLAHCAQSIEYSMTGYPASRSALFQRTVGSAALDFFAWRGRMTHDLSEPIPGAPSLPATSDAAAALHRLRTAIESFRAWSHPLLPHFAYGALSKGEYEVAHAMHLAEHLSHFAPAG